MASLFSVEGVTVIDVLTFAVKDTSEPDAHLLELLESGGPDTRIVVGGGDGTTTWVFSILDRIDKHPPLAVLPLGTANEAAGCIGWSRGDNGKRLSKFVRNVRSGPVIEIDLWKVLYTDSEDEKDQEVVAPPDRRPDLMIGFLSFGFDAKIAYLFHKTR